MVRMLAFGSDDALIKGVAEGLELIAEHVAHLQRSVEVLADAEEPRGIATVRAVADEEAAKYLILVDAIRCPRRAHKQRLRQLSYSNEHLAKGIYAYITGMSPADLDEIRRLLADLRVSHYLDGPMDVDWIFRNEIIDRRERTLYVDYVRDDDGAQWVAPDLHDDRLFMRGDPSDVVRLVGALTRAGIATEAGLRTVAEIWRRFVLRGETRWTGAARRNQMTLERLAEQDLLKNDFTDHDAQIVYRGWGFPLYEEDLRVKKVDVEELRERQRNFSPDFY